MRPHERAVPCPGKGDDSQIIFRPYSPNGSFAPLTRPKDVSPFHRVVQTEERCCLKASVYEYIDEAFEILEAAVLVQDHGVISRA